MGVKFHEKAIEIYGVAQVAEGVPAINLAPSGTIETTAASATVTGTGTKFKTEVAVGSYLYNFEKAIIGRVASITSNTELTLETVVPAAPTPQSAGVMAIAGPVTAPNNKYTLGLGPKNALAVLNLNFSTELDSEAFQYTGDELSRDEETVIKDKYANMDFEVFVPSLGTIAGSDPVISEVPMVDFFQSSGFAVVLSTGSGGYAKITNGVSSNSYLTIEVRRSSPDLASLVEQKSYIMTDARGLVDLDATVGTRGKLKFIYQGNLADIAQKLTLVPDFGDQKVQFAPSIKSSTVTLSELAVYTSAAEPSLTSTSNICFDKINAPNVAGFEYNRYLTSCLDGWSKGATPSDVTLTVLEDSADATYNPDDHLEDNHLLILRYGSAIGKKVEFLFHKLQLARVSNSKIANYAGQDLGMRNVGVTDIKLY